MNNKVSFTIIAILFQSLFFTSCVSTKITSNKDASFNRKLKKIYVICNLGKDVSNFNERLFEGVKKKFTENNITIDGFVRNPVALETDEDVLNKIRSYDPEALMIIKQTHVTYYNGGPGGGVFEVSLIDKVSQKNIWKSEIDVTGPWWDEDTSDSIVKKLILKLKEDQII
ncbi:hypothetical protein JN11_01505 [Mucilaginibacter frigoritolerans]|uniref:Lipoprotein n=1 Tax=Mucilaginibacter frigoritolerans TaxID=652788 RepID=A0A562U9L3_9SPHI|nr:hypothetical protein [Mucilaginibacter frigoritolerans]TWJ02532.1 hypothetical protein JN11_01505 [Mucilaginibacter frigoritolerans]